MTATQFAMHGQMYQAVSAQAAAIHDQFVAMLESSALSYAATEAANARQPANEYRNGFQRIITEINSGRMYPVPARGR